MKYVLALMALLLASPAMAADDAVILTPGVGVTLKSLDVGGGKQAMQRLPFGILDANNSSTANLGAGAVFTGTGTDVSSYAQISVYVVSNGSSQANGVSLQWSSDNVTYDDASVATYTVGSGANAGQVFSTGVRAKYFRVVYTNGGTIQTSFKLSTLLQGAAGTGDIIDLGVTMDQNTHALATKSLMVGATGSTTANIQTANGTNTNAMRVTMANDSTGILAGVTTVGAVTTVTNPVTVAQATPGNLLATVSIASAQTLSTVTTLTTLTGGGVANNAADSGNPVKVGGVYNLSPITLDNGDRGDAQLDVNGNLKVVGIGLVNGATTSGTTGSAVMCATTTAIAGGSNATTNWLNCTPAGALRTDTATLAGTTIATSNGSLTAGVQRVTIATDSVAVPLWGHGATAAAPPANAVYMGANTGQATTGGKMAGLITCDNHVFKHITSVTDTLAVQGVASQTIYICGWRARAAGVATWYLENTASTNANCSSTLTQITGVATEAANTGETVLASFWTGLKNTSGNGLCINSTGTGGVDIDIWYTQF